MRASEPLSWVGRNRLAMTESQRRRRRRSRTATVLLLSSVLTVTSLGGQALAVPGDGMSREQTTSQVDLPDIPESTALADDASAEKALSLGDEQQVVPYAPENVAPWAEDAGKAPLTAQTQPGTTVPVVNETTSVGLPVAVGVPIGQDPTKVDGDWRVAVKSTTTSEETGVPGMILEVVPPAV